MLHIKKEFTSEKEVEEFIKDFQGNKEYIVDVFCPSENKFIVQIQTQKFYNAWDDGKSYPDEVWFTEEGDMIQIQDLTGEHMRNIIRRKIREERQMREAIASMMEVPVENVHMGLPEATRTLH